MSTIDTAELLRAERQERDRTRAETMLRESQARADAFFARLNGASAAKFGPVPRKAEPLALAWDI